MNPIPNRPFLWHVADHLIKTYGNDLSNLTLVFPNKRASLFINEYLAEQTQGPIWSPRFMTISDLFRSHSPFTVGDDIKLICDLYQSFVTCTGSTETLDQFYGWGAVLLSDFDDIDKNMADAHSLFSNLRDLHAMDTTDYLSEAQIKVLQHFFRDFKEDHNSLLKEKFLRLWSKFGDIYEDYHQRLSEQHLAYEGALYRQVVEDPQVDYGEDTYLFVGFNALLEVERRLFRQLKHQGQAKFYWDFDHYYMRDLPEGNVHEAGQHVKRYLLDFPNQFDNHNDTIYNHFNDEKQITITGVPTDSAQARYVGKWLQDSERVKAGNKSAVVLCDERLLPIVIHSIPDSVSSLNITTGFPLHQTTAASLVVLLTELALYGNPSAEKYRLRHVVAILRHPYANYLSPLSTELCERLVSTHRYYPVRKELALDGGLQLLFRDLKSTNDGSTYHEIYVINQWILDVIRTVAMAAQQIEQESPLTHESLYRTYTLLNRIHGLIKSGDLKVDPVTYQRVIQQVLSMTKVPFHGEPAEGLQVMGVLETRNLDFDHLLVLSCNEGNMPKAGELPSFIPQSLRNAFGLTTIDHQASIYAYYFYRMIQRAQDITLLYGNANDDKKTGEKSRFMLQLMVESQHQINKKALVTSQSGSFRERIAIEKDSNVLKKLNNIDYLSPTAINHYLQCPLDYYYSHLANIKETIEDSEEIDNRMFGIIFHDTAQEFYDQLTGTPSADPHSSQSLTGPGHHLSRQQLEHALQDPSLLERCLDKVLAAQLFKIQDSRSAPTFNGLQISNRRGIRHYLKRLLKIDLKLSPFTIRGHEGSVFSTITTHTSQGKREIRIGGRIDRLDEVTAEDGQRILRVVDYKTGNSTVKDIKNIEDIFDPSRKNHGDYCLQAMLYAMIVSRDKDINPQGQAVAPALLFIQHAGAEEYNPMLTINGNIITDKQHYEAFEKQLSEVVGHLLEPTEPFIPTEDRSKCVSCSYNALCGRIKRIS